ncbi:hypothetical protein GS518_11175 [Leptospira interrogans]|uniref:Tetratricopeptide repeat protein n=2 Tax=Leptospira interrogans TaxID=173 RepID=Q72Q64_LEPIC|nr:hypothetical protein [Leptospira interrogans]AAS70821.1 conserved hypothetical protein [Leptospira interrogans serovar Copenhageni str. Fiocruz L1-130]ARB94985.1 hypothetical protein A6J42_04880 [Leptospira interrogans serovar Copenhageni]EKP23907.1 hypothetical protein LEP1GSC117_3674 [Leptospira interrogans serovar Icterohaemorrhagiae str. Verdun LP]EKP75947.1 hypothetical protein LEP1GSC173_1150 [Leptospira interrogans str. HAI1594]EMO16460.1 hypothetical protein LEP1GSC167_2470 [Leptosp
MAKRVESNNENAVDPFFKLMSFQKIFSSFSIEISKCQSLWNVSFVLLIFGFYCSTISMPGSGRFALEMVQEQAILEFYGTPEERESSVKLLKSSCRSLHPDRALSCYNLSILLASSKNYSEALEYALRARKADPSDSLYRDQVFQIAYHLELEQGEALSVDEVEKRYFRAIKNCKEGKKNETLSDLIVLAALKEIGKESLQKGIFAECVGESESLVHLKPNEVNYIKEYYKFLENSHPYKEVWDVSGTVRRQTLEKMQIPNQEVTKTWKEFRQSVRSKNKIQAVEHLKKFKESLEKVSQKSQQSKNLALNLKKAAFYLIQGDPSFEGFRHLTKELEDNP